MTDAARPMTYGERLVGLDFNPSGDETVRRLKELFAEIVDICVDKGGLEETAGSAGPVWREAIMRALDAQMWTVKGATWRGP